MASLQLKDKEGQMDKDRSVALELRTVRNLLKRQVDGFISQKFGDQLTGMHGWALKFFIDNKDKDIFQRDFEHQFSIRRSTASKILQLMEKNNLITRQSVPYDARLKRIVFTPTAVEYYEAIIGKYVELERELKSGLSREELDTFFGVLDKIKSNLEQRSS
ncbi:MarR family winged helix-turn-helix transcriptional regulator [Paenibacillus arenilitoris]|uniref:Winged helix-turn-helix transcriptional regulator n=1 Tax=Paenibacillus arenilitoris TaxID=2772299 RepID=A0A927H3Q5_9BACL|nr:MarR family winged helix-turn-helix transcriptional regulator [Paenibacillus arenilitoris]MBD2867110.1 winged helix-turn-helix transcriptional regulator [Paenibacillus arenilitoris]